jgi:DNA-binding MarR family transcriptional regulator
MLEKKLKHLQSQTLRISDLTPPQFMVLKLLSEKDKRPFKDLAEELCCTRATVTGIIDTMGKKELVNRLPNLEDRRSMLVQITAKGQNVMIQSAPQIGQSFSNCCDILNSDETQELSMLLKKLNQALNF